MKRPHAPGVQSVAGIHCHRQGQKNIDPVVRRNKRNCCTTGVVYTDLDRSGLGPGDEHSRSSGTDKQN